MLIGEWFFHQAQRLLDDPDTPTLDRRELGGEALDDTMKALSYLEKSTRAVPGVIAYRTASSEIFMNLATYEVLMGQLGQHVPVRIPPNIGERATLAAREAIQRSPVKADLHISLGNILRERGHTIDAERSLERSTTLYPSLPSIHLAVAVSYMRMHNDAMALQHAFRAARSDDSYILDSKHTLDYYREHQPEQYRLRLRKSYLYKAFDVSWRLSKKNKDLLYRMSPENTFANATLELFLVDVGAN
jgi:tetratricopeptide (TPR) repeat protein